MKPFAVFLTALAIMIISSMQLLRRILRPRRIFIASPRITTTGATRTTRLFERCGSAYVDNKLTDYSLSRCWRGACTQGTARQSQGDADRELEQGRPH